MGSQQVWHAGPSQALQSGKNTIQQLCVFSVVILSQLIAASAVSLHSSDNYAIYPMIFRARPLIITQWNMKRCVAVLERRPGPLAQHLNPDSATK